MLEDERRCCRLFGHAQAVAWSAKINAPNGVRLQTRDTAVCAGGGLATKRSAVSRNDWCVRRDWSNRDPEVRTDTCSRGPEGSKGGAASNAIDPWAPRSGSVGIVQPCLQGRRVRVTPG